MDQELKNQYPLISGTYSLFICRNAEEAGPD